MKNSGESDIATWHERAQQALGSAAGHMGYFVRAVALGRFHDTGEGRGAPWLADSVSNDLRRVKNCVEHAESATPTCEHALLSAGEGCFQIYEWCVRCGALFMNGEMALPDADADAEDVRWT